MNPYQQKKRWKYILIAFAVIIASGSLFYTNYLVKNIARSERTRAQVWALSMKQITIADDNDFLQYVFTVRDSLLVPAIMVNGRGEIKYVRGLDPTKTNINVPGADKIKGSPKYDPGYFASELAYMKKQHAPIEVVMLGNKYLVYYKDSPLLQQLKIFPYVQLSVIAIFLVMAYTAFNTSRKSEQNQVWVGLAKETAHQLGTPISSLMAWIELIKDKFHADKDPLMAEMENDVKRLEIIADRFSKIGSKPKLEEHSVYYVIKDFVDYFSVRVSNNISFEITGNPYLKAGLNVPLFDWVLENLLKNAVNAIEGRGKIKVEISTNKTKKNQIIIDITDTGKGIPRSKFDTVFQPGYTTRKRGWGLGLSLTKRIVRNYHNGNVFVRDSELGKGTTFRITLKSIQNDKKPQPDEYPAYAAPYVAKVPNGPVMEILEYLKESTYNFFSRMTDEQADYAYAEGKWTVKQVLGHMIDTERLFSFRALCFSRREQQEMPGFDQDDYVKYSTYENRSIQSLAMEFKLLREVNIFLYESFTEEQGLLSGIANKNPVSVRALVYMTAGHELYHLDLIKEKYI